MVCISHSALNGRFLALEQHVRNNRDRSSLAGMDASGWAECPCQAESQCDSLPARFYADIEHVP